MVNMNDSDDLRMRDGEKLVLSFLVAFTVPWVIALAINFLIVKNLFVMLGIGIALTTYTVIGGYQRNGEFEN